MSSQTRVKLQRGMALVFAVGLSAFLLLNQEKIAGMQVLGYPGIFLLTMLSNATIILPVPGVLISSTMGAVFNPLWVGVTAGAGAAVGELVGYVAGYSGRGIIEKSEWSTRVEEWVRKYGSFAVLVLAFIPNPLFDIVGITAGILKMPLPKFLFWCVLGKILKMLVFSYGGDFILGKFPWF
jgi:membrane protein DedA with SNARE-associated domain